jgi:lipopolysaccharide export system protein LptA
MKKSFHILISLFFMHTICAGPDPFSKIVIESEQATAYKDPENPAVWVLHYDNNVHVSFADNSTIHADHLEVAFNVTRDKKQKEKSAPSGNFSPIKPTANLDTIKHIIFKNNVTIANDNRHATAQKATLFLTQKTCNLEGNVVIWQDKKEAKDIPFSVKSDAAQFDFTKDAISFSGRPVSSSFDLSSTISKKKKSKKDVNKN